MSPEVVVVRKICPIILLACQLAIHVASGYPSALASAASSVALDTSLDSVSGNDANTNLIHYNVPADMPPAVKQLRDRFETEIKANPNLYNLDDVREFFEDPTHWSVQRFLNQRSQDVERAYQLVLNTMRWRAKMGLGLIDASYFPCDLFKMGLIFEHGHTHQTDAGDGNGSGEPVIWIRLGALGQVAKKMEQYTPTRLASFAYTKARRFSRSSRDRMRNRFLRVAPAQRVDKPIINDLSVRNDKTMAHILRAIAWWIDDWERQHPNVKATLVLDFESSDGIFQSWSMGDFFIGLDDNFPDLFKQVIGFRYKPKIWSIHAPVSMFNRIFQSHLASSPETDGKLRFVQIAPQLNDYIPEVDSQGFTMIPAHVKGFCEPMIAVQVPQGCQADSRVLISQGLYEPRIYNFLSENFAKVCRNLPTRKVLRRTRSF